MDSPGIPDLGPGPRPRVMSSEKLGEQMDVLLGQAVLPRRVQDLIRGTLLLWHDNLDAAHSIAQSLEDADGSLLHAIMHRREPDYGNSKYWFRRTGKHACYPAIAERVGALAASDQKPLVYRITPNSRWDPFAFVDLCQEAAQGKPKASHSQLLQKVQRFEFEAWLDYLLAQS